ncbi:MAG: hypothetical protein KF729_03165 [Sandaracinaceae bacterium]|nr:hypothetical protein [Sandaracinaceae bacterium]
MRSTPAVALLLFACALALLPACAPAIGDSCTSDFNCSISLDRRCDRARPGGACTIFGCEADTCPNDALCVRWRPEPSRLTFTACMAACEQDGDCRVDDGYRCLAADDIRETAEGGDVVAEVVDVERGGRFCVSTDPNPGD